MSCDLQENKNKKSIEEQKDLLEELENSPEKESKTSASDSNTIGAVLSGIGWFFIILSIVIALFQIKHIGIFMAIVYGAVGSFSGLLLLGFGEMLGLLQDIKNKI